MGSAIARPAEVQPQPDADANAELNRYIASNGSFTNLTGVILDPDQVDHCPGRPIGVCTLFR